jgi:transposase-like protein
MNAKENYPKTLVEAVRYFSNLDVAQAFFTAMRWPGGVVCCPTCGSVEVKYLANYRRWECKEKHPRRQFTVKVGTIMEDSPMSLDKWAVAFWLEANAKNSISSYEIHRALGITQKSAWFMQHRIRLALQSKAAGKLSGPVEADETFIGGSSRNMHAKRRKQIVKGRGAGASGKTAVMGMLARGGEVRCAVVPDVGGATMQAEVRRHVEPGSHLLTDAWLAYRSLVPDYMHSFVDHTVEYVRGSIHTNGLENFWSLLKRCIKGTHVQVEPYHLHRYVDAEAFRFNNRKTDDGERFLRALSGMAGKRLTYDALISGTEFHPASRDSGAASAGLPN